MMPVPSEGMAPMLQHGDDGHTDVVGARGVDDNIASKAVAGRVVARVLLDLEDGVNCWGGYIGGGSSGDFYFTG